jgi:predicted nucleotidyltransferase
MPRNSSPLRSADAHATTEIAIGAARLIADEGMDYATAKRRAARDVLGEANARGLLPDNDRIEEELRRHLRLFGGEEHKALLLDLRRHALTLMRQLERFEPRLVGAVLNGTATEFSDLQIRLYCDDVKEVEMHLLNAGIDFDAEEGDPEPGGAIERIHFVTVIPRQGAQRHRTGVTVAVHPPVALRVSPRHRSSDGDLHPVEASGRASIDQLQSLPGVDDDPSP